MSGQGAGQLVVYAGALLVLAHPLGAWMARVYGPFRAPGLLGVAERGFLRLVRSDTAEEQDWRTALGALFTPVLALGLTAVSIVSPAGLRSVFNSGAHGFTEGCTPGPRWRTRTAAPSTAGLMLLPALALGPIVEGLEL
jgi:K+-transporting ATPase A subunit